MIINANSENEALEIAKNELNLQDGNYTLKIIKKPKQSWINIIKKMGTYEITLLAQELDQNQKIEELTTILDASSAYVAIHEGKIEVFNPLQDEKFPILYIENDHISLTVNNQIIKSHVTLKEKDVINITFSHIEPVAYATLTISEDKMEATLNIIQQDGKSFYLMDMEKTNRGHIDVGFNKIPPKNVTLEQCLELLENAHIQKNLIDLERIKLLIDDTNSCSDIVARGIPLNESRAAEITYSPVLSEKAIIDGLEPIVDKDETLAFKKHDAIMGTEGFTLLGQELKPKNVTDILLQVGEGALLVDDGKRVISAIKGRPYLKKGLIRVVPIQFVNGDLSKELGDIRFEGDVIVKGNVLDDISIYATGNIEISGSVYNANVIALGSVLITGKAISCKVQSGVDTSKLYLASPYFQKIRTCIIDMFQKIKSNHTSQPQDKLDIIYKYKKIMEDHMKSICEVSSLMENKDNQQVNDLMKTLKNSLLQITLLKEIGFKMLYTFYNELGEFLEETTLLSDEMINLTLFYAQGCELHSCGNIVITGKGSYQTNMVAQNEIIYTTPLSVVKGGTLIAGSKITAGIVGTVGEVYTECRVLQEEGTVKASFYRGSVVYINNVKQDIVTTSSR